MEGENRVFMAIILFLAATAIVMGLLIVILPADEGFSELYFIGDLPERASAGVKTSFSFGIRNLESKDMGYDYAVSLDGRAIDSGSIEVEAGKAGTIVSSFTLEKSRDGDPGSESKEPALVSVRLVGLEQEIHFWVVPE